MRILFVNNDIGRLGGIDKCFQDDVDLFKKYGHEIYTLVTNKRKHLVGAFNCFYKEPSFAPLRYLCAYFDLMFFIKIFKWLNEVKPDVIHIHGYPLQIITLMLLLRLKKMPFFQTVHDITFVISPHKLLFQDESFAEKRGYLWFLIYGPREYLRLWLSKKWTTAFIAPSKALAGLMAKWGFAKTEQIYNYIDTDIIKYQDLNTASNTIIYIGRLSGIKGVEYLIEAMPVVLRKFPKTELQIIGHGPEAVRLAKLTDNMNVVKNIKFMGALPAEMTKNYLTSASFSIAPSIAFDNNPLSVIESMALGRPVIGSNIGGIPELVINKKTGLLVKPGDSDQITKAIILLLSDPKTIQAYGQNARKLIEEQCAPKIHLDRLMKLYNKYAHHES